MKVLTIKHVRKIYTKDATIGMIYIDNKFFCYTLEDTIRPYGIKVKHFTGIPVSPINGYCVGKRFSPSFNRDMLILHTEDSVDSINFGGIKFTYVYAHGGNKPEDTDGCILVAYHLDQATNRIYGSAEKDLAKIVFDALDKGIDVRWKISNVPQEN